MKKIKIHQKMIYNFVVFIILPIVLASLLIFHYYGEILQNKVGNSMQQVLTQTANNINYIVDSSIAASNIICMDKKLADNITKADKEPNAWNQFESSMSIYNRLKEVQNATLFNFNGELSIMDFNGNFYSADSIKSDKKNYEDMSKKDWFKTVTDLNGFICWDKQDPSKTGVITISRMIKGYKAVGGYGILTITLPESAFWNVIKQGNTTLNGTTVLLDNQYKVISADYQNYDNDIFLHSNLRDLVENGKNNEVFYTSDGVKTIINFQHIKKTNWIIVNLMPYENMMYEVNNLKAQTYLFYLGIMIVFIILTIYISRHISNPIKQLEKHMGLVQNGDFSIRTGIGGFQEIEKLGDSFNTMVVKIDDLLKQVEEETKKKQKANLEALQAQINPHFLFNTLNSIRWMANISGNENVSNMLSDLGKLLEGSIYKSDELITLKEEIDYLNSYVSLQKMRFGDNFTIHYKIEEDIIHCSIPKFVLQPIIENSIIHGISDMSGGIISVTGYVDYPNAVIKISDNGIGIDEQQIPNILAEENSKKGRLSKIGFKNVDQRLKLKFGEQYGLSIKSSKGKGTVVDVVIPFEIEIPMNKYKN